ILANEKDAQGRPKKRAFGPGMMKWFRVLAKLRGLRGTPFDIFSYSPDRKLERELISDYEKDVASVLGQLSAANIDAAVELLSLPDPTPGPGPKKEKPHKAPKPPPRPTPRRSRQSATRTTPDGGGVTLSGFRRVGKAKRAHHHSPNNPEI